MITLPVLIGYTTGKPGQFGYYAEGGFKFSIPLNVTYNNYGNYEFTAPPYSIFLKNEFNEYDPPLPTVLGFYNRENINETGETKLTGISLSFYLSAGVNIPLGYYASVMIGPEINIGISDIMGDNDKYTDIFKKQYDHQPVKLRSFGLRVGFVYKL
jgi:hypothetical protein